jgi:hypothetical protein
MRYESNLKLPAALAEALDGFKLANPVYKTLMGHDMPSDPDYDPNCGYWTHDEAAILSAILSDIRFTGKEAVDIGCRFGWTSKIINWNTNAFVACVDPGLQQQKHFERFWVNTGFPAYWTFAETAASFLRHPRTMKYSIFVIDGNHDEPEPLNDARGALANAAEECVIFLHDFWGRPIQDAAAFLCSVGFNCKVYRTPNGVACCWRGFDGWKPPEHLADVLINWDQVRADNAPSFDFEACL